jgi:hypothetical protein
MILNFSTKPPSIIHINVNNPINIFVKATDVGIEAPNKIKKKFFKSDILFIKSIC